MLYEKRDSSGDSCRVKICSSCSSIKEEPTDGVSDHHSGRPNNWTNRPSKIESVGQLDFRKLQPLKNEDDDDDQMNPEDYLEVGYHDDPEKLIRLSENQYDKRKIRKQAKKVAKAGKQSVGVFHMIDQSSAVSNLIPKESLFWFLSHVF